MSWYDAYFVFLVTISAAMGFLLRDLALYLVKKRMRGEE